MTTADAPTGRLLDPGNTQQVPLYPRNSESNFPHDRICRVSSVGSTGPAD